MEGYCFGQPKAADSKAFVACGCFQMLTYSQSEHPQEELKEEKFAVNILHTQLLSNKFLCNVMVMSR